MCIWAEEICSIFTSDANAIYYGAMQLRHQLPLYMIFTWNEIINGAVQSSGHTVVPMMVSMFGMCVARVTFILVGLQIVNDVRVIYLAFPFSWIVTHIGITSYFYFGKWLHGMRYRDAVIVQKV